jgi:hypothetical protein
VPVPKEMNGWSWRSHGVWTWKKWRSFDMVNGLPTD